MIFTPPRFFLGGGKLFLGGVEGGKVYQGGGKLNFKLKMNEFEHFLKKILAFWRPKGAKISVLAENEWI